MEQNKTAIGSLMGTIIIIAIIILGGLYFWGKRVEESKAKEKLVSSNVSTMPTEDNEALLIKSTSTDDDLSSIEADLNSTNLNNLSAEANMAAE